MISPEFGITTKRLQLKQWQETDRSGFAELHADPVVMGDMGGPIDRKRANEKFERYLKAWSDFQFGRWAVHKDDEFLGYVGIMPRREFNPIGPHDEIGWRLFERYWGQGYATEAARAALVDIFTRTNLSSVLAYTTSTNGRSRRVMQRLNFQRTPALDFSLQEIDIGEWNGLVWETKATEWLE